LVGYSSCKAAKREIRKPVEEASSVSASDEHQADPPPHATTKDAGLELHAIGLGFLDRCNF